MLFDRIRTEVALHRGKQPKTAVSTKNGLITYYDWSYNADADMQWFTKFILHNFPEQRQKLNFYGVFGKGKFVRQAIDGKKIFFSMENLDKKNTGWNRKFGDYCLPYVDLSMGFGDVMNDKYFRFPLWIQYLFSPTADRQEIAQTIKEINGAWYPKTKECALIAGHDKHGTREMIYRGVKDILQVEFAGRWNNNTQDLWVNYDNNKIEYLKKFKFNICPENINTNLYVTEKLFEAFQAASIPIYYGSNNIPEEGIVNPEAVIFWNPREDNENARRLIVELKENEAFYQSFMQKPKLLPGTVDYVWNCYTMLEQRLSLLLR